MSPIGLYYLHFANISKYYRRIEGKKQSVFIDQIPLLSKIRNKYIRSGIYLIALFVEPFVSVSIVTGMLPFFLLFSLTTKKKEMSGKLFLGHAPIIKERLKSSGLEYEAIDWLYPISVSKKKKNGKERIHTLFEYVSPLEVVWCYMMSVCAIFYATVINKFQVLYRNYNAFEFYLTYYYLKNIPDNIVLYFSNQIDRWATVFDRIPGKEKVLLQHGIDKPNADWPVKFENTGTVYAFSEEESKILLKEEFLNVPMIKLMKPTINLTDMGNKTFGVLIVSFPAYQKYKEEEAYIKGLQDERITVFLKIHPGKYDYSKYTKLIEEYHFVLITDNTFPDVDIVISYRSTLAVEYQAHHRKVLFDYEHTTVEIIQMIKDEANKQA